MFSSFAEFFRGRHVDCDCCDHNVDIAILLDDVNAMEDQTMKKQLKKILASLRWEGLKRKYRKRKAAAKETIGKRFKHVYERVRRARGKKSFIVRRGRAHQAFNAVSNADKQVDPLKTAVRQLLTTMFADIVEDDCTAKYISSTTQCFLVHPLPDLDPNGSFLSRFTQLPQDKFDMDFSYALSFVSSWLQSSLAKMKILYPEGVCTLQMPFCVLETTQAAANVRARALQRLNPNEKVGIATLDIEALKGGKLVASAQHTFDFLRVSRQDFLCRKKLLAWAESDEWGQSARALRSAVLTVVEWKDTGEDTSAESQEEELRVAAQTPLPDDEGDDEGEEQWAKWANLTEKKDSGTISQTASKSSRGGVPDLQSISATEEGGYPRFCSL